jgi:hypothetical protein
MNRVIWPGTLGYYMQQLMRPIFGATAIANARTYFESYVRPRGPAPAFRIGSTPYGVLPIAALREWAPRTFGSSGSLDTAMQSVEDALLGPLQDLLQIWVQGSFNVPRLQPTSASPDVDLAKVLATHPSSREFRIRLGKGIIPTTQHYLLEGWDVAQLLRRLRRQSRDTFGRIGHREWFPPIGKTLWNEGAWNLPFTPVAPELSETDALPDFNVFRAIEAATARQLNAMSHVGAAPSNILYLTLRHSTLAEYARIAGEQLLTEWVEYEVFGITGTTSVKIVPSVYQLEDLTLLKSIACSARPWTQCRTASTLGFRPLLTAVWPTCVTRKRTRSSRQRATSSVAMAGSKRCARARRPRRFRCQMAVRRSASPGTAASCTRPR